MIKRFAAVAALATIAAFADEPAPTGTIAAVTELRADPNDPGVARAKSDLDNIRSLVAHGGLPYLRLERAREDMQDAEDLAILRAHLYGKDLLPEQAEQLVTIAQRMVTRRQKSFTRTQQVRPFCRLRTRSLVPKGSVRCAHVRSSES